MKVLAAPDAAQTVLVVVGVVLGVALVALFVTAVVSILRSDRLSTPARVGWIAIVLVFQLIGPLAWFLWGRHRTFGPAGR